MSALSASHRAEPFRSRVFALDYFSDSIYTQQSTLTIIMIIVFNNKRVVQWSAPTHFTRISQTVVIKLLHIDVLMLHGLSVTS